jgi:hypothetical protein
MRSGCLQFGKLCSKLYWCREALIDEIRMKIDTAQDKIKRNRINYCSEEHFEDLIDTGNILNDCVLVVLSNP